LDAAGDGAAETLDQTGLQGADVGFPRYGMFSRLSGAVQPLLSVVVSDRQWTCRLLGLALDARAEMVHPASCPGRK